MNYEQYQDTRTDPIQPLRSTSGATYQAEEKEDGKTNHGKNNQSWYRGQRPLDHEHNHGPKTHLEILHDNLHDRSSNSTLGDRWECGWIRSKIHEHLAVSRA